MVPASLLCHSANPPLPAGRVQALGPGRVLQRPREGLSLRGLPLWLRHVATAALHLQPRQQPGGFPEGPKLSSWCRSSTEGVAAAKFALVHSGEGK